MNDLKKLYERRTLLNQYLEKERVAKKPSQAYMDDLLLSIENIDKQLQWVKRNPNGFEHLKVNGHVAQ